MNDMERRTFEESFKDAFKGAEVSPTENVWTNIELEITKAEGSKMKQRLLFYKMLAAASIAFAMCLTGIGYYTLTSNENGTNQIAQNKNAVPNTTSSDKRNFDSASTDNVEASQLVTERSSKDDEILINKKSKNQQQIASRKTPTTSIHDERSAYISRNVDQDVSSNTNTLKAETLFAKESAASYEDVRTTGIDDEAKKTDRPLPPLYTFNNAVPSFHKEEEHEADPVALMFARLNELERELSGADEEKESQPREKLWTSVGFAAGSFNSVNPSVSSPMQSLASSNQVANKQAKASGTAYSLGLSFGSQISKRWVIQGGLNYLTQLSDYTTNQAVSSSDLQFFKAASLNELREKADNRVISTAPYAVNNSVRFISVPVQAGYLIVNKRVGVQLNAGVSTDMFLQNTIDPQGNGLEKTTQGRGEDSPYRTINFSGLIGSELSYRIADRYRIALNPGLRLPFDSIYKDEVGVEATPLTFDLGLRFRYIFK